MTSLKEASENYESSMISNIADLEKVDIHWELKEDSQDWGEGPKKYEYFEINELRYRVPATVKQQLKAHLESNPKLVYFKVTKTGSGLNTNYIVIPLNVQKDYGDFKQNG